MVIQSYAQKKHDFLSATCKCSVNSSQVMIQYRYIYMYKSNGLSVICAYFKCMISESYKKLCHDVHQGYHNTKDVYHSYCSGYHDPCYGYHRWYQDHHHVDLGTYQHICWKISNIYIHVSVFIIHVWISLLTSWFPSYMYGYHY